MSIQLPGLGARLFVLKHSWDFLGEGGDEKDLPVSSHLQRISVSMQQQQGYAVPHKHLRKAHRF